MNSLECFRVSEKERREGTTVDSELLQYDTEFINKVIKGIDLNCGEFWIRRKFMNYSQLIVDMAFHGSEFNSKSSSTLVKIKDANTSRISDWKDTSSYLFAANVEDMMDKRRVVTGMDVGKHVRLLHTAMQGWRTLTIENVNKIFTHFVSRVVVVKVVDGGVCLTLMSIVG
eukprot:TRINITY_DN916_c0_g2_i5.p2 TRINITY_DN916_c0_g2~~TRINITY_DN916_c0_g2_i5.p2  ORF type:complete len:171 (-),score=38.27 TRINITY_DN916_c0_g2_i5:596-1108(-)